MLIMRFLRFFAFVLANLLRLHAFTCSVVKNNTELFSYDIEEFMVNDGICDCCDCSDEPSMTNKVSFCDELINEYESVLENGLVRDTIDLGKKTLINTLILNNNDIVKEYESLKEDMKHFEEIEDVKIYEKLSNEIIEFFEDSLKNKKSHAQVSKKHQKENIDNLKKFFHKEIPLIMIDDKDGLKKIHSDIKNLKSLKDKLMIVKFMLSNLEGNSGVSFKHTQDLFHLDDIVERYGNEFFKKNKMFIVTNFVKDSIYGVDSRVSTYKLQQKKQSEQRLKELESELERIYDSYKNVDVTSEILKFFTEYENKFTVPMKSIFGKYEYIFTPEKKLIQKSLGENNEQYLIGELKNIEFKNETIANHYDDIHEILWKYVQTQYATKHLHKSIPNAESKITNELLNKNNIMKITFENGDECWNGPERSAVVRFQCSSSEFDVVEVLEVEKCTYEIDVNSIFGCL
ncbi:hypothetical protein FOG48_01579 [Hanseniaspora uvarum]|nr:hypothetical protein FOG48_01579 [Hanseniaspora uvarum]GMM41837.1 hypothetical protein DAHU10_027470 [Hanseniaspora uvarum]